jgi:hypothetical protein
MFLSLTLVTAAGGGGHCSTKSPWRRQAGLPVLLLYWYIGTITGVAEAMVKELTDRELLEQFERATLAPECFRHTEHVRVAFLYLSRFPVLEALPAFSTALRRFAAKHGKLKRYNETVTWAYIFLIRERLARARKRLSWEEFAQDNADLLSCHGGILARFYREETLQSDLAREVFVFPDKCEPAP